MLYPLEAVGGTSEIPLAKVREMMRKLVTLRERAKEVKTAHGSNPPDEIKQELMTALQNIV
jgi:hypothetical protein